MPYYPKHYIKTNLYTEGKEFYLKGTDRLYTGYYWVAAGTRYFTGETPQTTPQYELIPVNTALVQGLSTYTDEPLYTEKVKLAVEGEAPIVGDGTGPYDYNIISGYLKSISKTQNDYPVKTLPSYRQVLPTEQDYQIGEFRRYFCKKTNELTYLEIDIPTYKALNSKSSTICWDLYTPFNLIWALTGDKDTVYNTNKKLTENTIKVVGLPKLGDYLKHDYLKYYR